MMSRATAASPENRRIDSWKEIAAFFGRDERTVKRWEKERGLPVHRLPGERGGVFAWSHELTAWLNSAASRNGKADAAAAPAAAPPETPPIAVEPAPDATPQSRHVRLWTSIAAVAVLVVFVTGFFVRRHLLAQRTNRNSGPVAVHHVPNEQAREFYLKGRYYWSRRTDGSLRQALDAFTQAVINDSDYAQAYAGLAECYDLMPEFTSMSEAEAFPRAITAARKALSLDDSLSEAHRALGFALFFWEWKTATALGEFQRAIELDPRDGEAHHWLATTLLTLGQYREAAAEIAKAREIDPASRSILCDEALIRYWVGDRAHALMKLREIEQAEPEFLSAPRYLAGLAFDEKDYRTFIEQTRRLGTLSGDQQLLDLADAAQRGLAKSGYRGMLEAMRVVQLRYFSSGKASGLDLARTCALLGRKQEALNYLNAAVANHDYMVMTAYASPDFASLHNDPAFEQFCRQVNERIHRA